MPSWIKAKRLSAFTALPYGGNPAWVVLGAEDLIDSEMQTIASDLNPTSDTAFVCSESTHEADISQLASRNVIFRDGRVRKEVMVEKVKNANEELAKLPVEDDEY